MRCRFAISDGAITRQCLLHMNHEFPDPADSLKGRVPIGSKPHEIAPICSHCGQVEHTTPGDQKNEFYDGKTREKISK